MKKKFVTVALAATATAALAAPAAHAGLLDEYDAADQVERVAYKRYHIDPIASCRTLGGGRFTCKITDFKGSCSYDGRANVRKTSAYGYRVSSMHVNRDCF